KRRARDIGAETRGNKRGEFSLELVGRDRVLGVASRIFARGSLACPALPAIACGETGSCQADGPRRRILCAEIIGNDHVDASKKLRDGWIANAVRPESLIAELLEAERPFEQRGAHAVGEAELRLIWRARIHLLHDLVTRPIRLDGDA